MLGNMEDEKDFEGTITGHKIQVKLQNVSFRKQSIVSLDSLYIVDAILI